MINSKRQEKILRIFTESDKIFTGEELCTIVGVSSRTIRNDIKELNYFLTNNGATIVSEKGKGYKLKVDDKETYSTFIDEIKSPNTDSNINVEDRVDYILVRLLEVELKGKEAITLNELADELFISLSSLKNDLKIVKEFLNTNDLKLEKIGHKGIGIVGPEDKIRSVINQLLFKPNYTFINMFKNIFKQRLSGDNNALVDVIKEVIVKFNLRLSDVAFGSLVSHIATTLIRNEQGKNMTYSEEELSNFKKEIKYESGLKIAKKVENIFNIQLSESEVAYITKYILASNLMNIEKNSEEELERIVTKTIEEIDKRVKVNLRDDDLLEQFLVNHLKAAINRAKYNVRMDNPMLITIKVKYPYSFELAVQANKIIKEEVGVSLSENDIGYLALHFEASLERIKSKNVSRVKRAVVVCTTGMGTSLFLKVTLENTFKERLEIVDTLAWYEFNESDLKDIDIIISTVPLELHSKKVIYVKNLLDKDELKQIEAIISNNTNQQNPLIKYFDESLYFKGVEGDLGNKILEKIIEDLKALGYINDNIKRELLNREKLASTEIGNLVAIPHTIHEEIEKSFISVTILKKPILWQKENVQIILLIGMSNKDRNEFKECLERLYRGIIDLNIVLDMIKAEDYEGFIKVTEKL